MASIRSKTNMLDNISNNINKKMSLKNTQTINGINTSKQTISNYTENNIGGYMGVSGAYQLSSFLNESNYSSNSFGIGTQNIAEE